MIRPPAPVALLGAALPFVAVGMVVGGPVAEVSLALTAVLAPVLLIRLATRGRLPGVWLGLLGAVLAGSALLLLGFPTSGDSGGLPWQTLLAWVGIGLLPLVLTVVLHAVWFDRKPGAEREPGVPR